VADGDLVTFLTPTDDVLARLGPALSTGPPPGCRGSAERAAAAGLGARSPAHDPGGHATPVPGGRRHVALPVGSHPRPYDAY